MNNEVIEIENCIDDKATRRLHLMSNHELSAVDLACYPLPQGAKVDVRREGGVWHLRAEWPFFGAMDVKSEDWNKFKRIVVKAVRKGDRISVAVLDAAKEFARLFGRCPQFAFVRKLPKGVEPGQIIMFYGREMVLLDCEWVPDECVAVGGAEPVAVISEQCSVISDQ